jgi:hypothetical protein
MKSSLRTLAVVVVLALAWWLWTARAPNVATDSVPAPTTVAQADAHAADSTTAPSSQPASDSADAEEPAAADAEDSSEPAPAARETFRVRGAVVRALDGTGAPGMLVHLGAPSGAEGAAKSSASDALGVFELELDREHWKLGSLAYALALEASTGRRRFEGLVRLDQDFVIELDDLTRLHGIVIAPEWTRALPISIAAFAPPLRGGPVHRWIANASVQPNGEFEMFARVPPLMDVARLEIAVGSLSTLTYDVAIDDLASDVGAEFLLELGALRVRVFDSMGAPRAGAEVRVTRLADGPRATAAAAKTDSLGLAAFTRPLGELELCVGAEGHRSVVEVLNFEGGELDHDVHLVQLSAEDELFGIVLLDTNEPVADAFVAAGPITIGDDVGTPGIRGARTDEHGEFRFAVASTAPLQLTAFHRDWGITEPQSVVADGRRLVVWLPRTGKLRVEVLTDAVPGPFRTGRAEYVLRHRENGAIESDARATLPLEIDELVAGEYDVFVLFEGLDAVAEGFARVEPGRTSSTVLAARAANWIDGRVSESNGEGVWGVLVRAEGRWPADVAARLCTAATSFSGHFRVLSADRTAELVVYDDTAEWARQRAAAGELSAIELQ